MKKLVLLFVAVVFSSLTWAQVSIKPGIGINVTDFSKVPDGTNNVQGKVGYQIGASALIGDKLYVEPGVFVQKQSTDFVVSGVENQNINISNEISSIRIPVNVGYHILGSESSPFALRVFGGPTASIVTNVKESNVLNLDKSDYKGMNWGAQVGAGVDLSFLYLDVSYEWGLNQFLKDASNAPKLQGAYITAGINF